MITPIAPSKSNTLNQWLAYLEICHPKKMDLGLDRLRIVAKRLGVLTFDCPVITVAGTNGKGSCVALTAAILMAAGYRVATYTSPHLIDYNERIQIAGQSVSDDVLCEAFIQIEKAREDVSLTYFEFTTLAALWLFKRTPLDAIILEVGLGGRLDAVNSVDADIAIISTIDLDHMEHLGSTREAIGNEKAGIMRANRPCVCGEFSIPQSVYNQAVALNVPFYRQGYSFDYQMDYPYWSWKGSQCVWNTLPLPQIELQNAATVLQAIVLLADRLPLTRVAVEQGLTQLAFPARFQIFKKGTWELIIDVAHNPAGGRCLSRRLRQRPCSGETYALVGMLKDKDTLHTLQPLKDQIDQWYLASLDAPRGGNFQQLNEALIALQVRREAISLFSSPRHAYRQAYQTLKTRDRLLVFGSFHTASAILNDAL